MQLITGGMGFIGLHTARALLDMGESCVLVTGSGAIREPDLHLLTIRAGRRLPVSQASIEQRFDPRNFGDRLDLVGLSRLQHAG